MVDRILQYFFPGIHEHLSDDRMASLFCEELGFPERVNVRWHLALCRYCRHRQADLEGRRAEEIIEGYQRVVNRRELSMSPKPRAEFAVRLSEHLRSLTPVRAPQQPRFIRRLIATNAVFVAVPVAIICVVVLSISVAGWQQRSPKITSEALLQKARIRDARNGNGEGGVVFQSVRITSRGGVLERGIYTDLHGKRTPKKVSMSPSQTSLEQQLSLAGVDWDRPISVVDYDLWRKHVRVSSEKVSRVGQHLLELTTSVPDSPVLAESLTVRETDFHPVRRTIDFRDAGTVEIAELDYRILPWSAVDDNKFEPLLSASRAVRHDAADVLDLPLLPRFVTPEQLENAELGARLALNQLHADHGEQIGIERRSQDILIEGVVDTDDRERELRRQLGLLPHVTLSIQSVADLKNSPVPADSYPVQVRTMPDQPSALELLLRKQGRSVQNSNQLAQQLANVVLTISQESKAITDLQTLFEPGKQRDIIASATLSELIYTHRERLLAAVELERELLRNACGSPMTDQLRKAATADLQTEASRNLRLLKELTQTDRSQEREGDVILASMCELTDAIHASAANLLQRQHAPFGGEK